MYPVNIVIKAFWVKKKTEIIDFLSYGALFYDLSFFNRWRVVYFQIVQLIKKFIIQLNSWEKQMYPFNIQHNIIGYEKNLLYNLAFKRDCQLAPSLGPKSVTRVW